MANNADSSSNAKPNSLLGSHTGSDVLPQRLYRVHCPGRSNTKYTLAEGFRCASDRSFSTRDTDFIPTLRNHLDWSCPLPSPFISTFSNISHIAGWTIELFKNEWNGVREVKIMEIDPKEIPDTDGQISVISVGKLVKDEKDSGIILGRRKPHQVKDEYLCLSVIPAKAILRITEISESEISKDKDGQKEIEEKLKKSDAQLLKPEPSIECSVSTSDIEMGGMEDDQSQIPTPDISHWPINEDEDTDMGGMEYLYASEHLSVEIHQALRFRGSTCRKPRHTSQISMIYRTS